MSLGFAERSRTKFFAFTYDSICIWKREEKFYWKAIRPSKPIFLSNDRVSVTHANGGLRDSRLTSYCAFMSLWASWSFLPASSVSAMCVQYLKVSFEISLARLVAQILSRRSFTAFKCGQRKNPSWAVYIFSVDKDSNREISWNSFHRNTFWMKQNKGIAKC